MSFFDGNYDSNKPFFEEEAEEVLQNYIETWNARPGTVVAMFWGNDAWKKRMIKADLAMSQFIEGMRIKPATKKRLADKFAEIYPEMVNLFKNLR